jgi:GDPmannose 4,6-dehydratase
MKALIFGANGQDGYYLSALLRKNGVEVIGITRAEGEYRGDVADISSVERIIKAHQPDYIFHFAANSTTRHSALFDNHAAISTGTLNILECVRLHCKNCKVFLSGSAMQFKNVGLPIDEGAEFDASSPYSVARIQSVYAARYFRTAFGLSVYIGYLFNHDSPRRSEQHVNQKIAQSVKRIAGGSGEKLILGNVDVEKEFNYAGDIVEAMWALVNQNEIFEAVIGSGRAHSIREWVDYCFTKIGKDWKNFVEIKNDFVPEYKVLVSKPQIIRNLGWEPKTSFSELADLMMM